LGLVTHQKEPAQRACENGQCNFPYGLPNKKRLKNYTLKTEKCCKSVDDV